MAGASEAADAEQIRLVETQILECNLQEARVFLREDADVGEIDPSDGTRSITGIVSLGVIEDEDGSKPCMWSFVPWAMTFRRTSI